MNHSIQEQFQQRFDNFQSRNLQLKKLSTQYAWGRVLFFFACIAGVVIMADNKLSEGIGFFIVVFLVGFLVLLKRHQKVKTEQRFNEELARINQEELQRLQGDYKDFDQGAEFITPTHNYHIDLDIFGKHSLFQLINRTSTTFGRNLLAKWLSKSAPKQAILQRHEAVKELGPKLDWRQRLQAHGRGAAGEKAETKYLFDWIREDNNTKGAGLYKSALLIMPLATLAALILAITGTIASGIPLLLIVVNMVILGTIFNRAKYIFEKTISSNAALKAYEAQISMIEDESFDSPYLNGLKEKFVHDQMKASKVIKQLQFILDNLHNRANMMYHIFNLLFIIDVYWVLQAEKWKENTKADIEPWFEAIGELECLASLAGFHFAKPDYAFPTISEVPFTIDGQGVGHPMIKESSRVNNTFDFSGKGGICLITGSNMSGKSTFLRTVGVNAVLGLMGAPVCATQFTVSNLKVFTSMRTQDDLEESVSSFYAELKRLRQMIESIDGSIPVLFMVDEVLKGTNSEDRHKGAIALIRQLNKAEAFGFVSTHDIGLGNITNELQGVKNYSFNSVIKGDEIIFDYTLTEGICKSFNATKLMQKMGIQIID